MLGRRELHSLQEAGHQGGQRWQPTASRGPRWPLLEASSGRRLGIGPAEAAAPRRRSRDEMHASSAAVLCVWSLQGSKRGRASALRWSLHQQARSAESSVEWPLGGEAGGPITSLGAVCSIVGHKEPAGRSGAPWQVPKHQHRMDVPCGRWATKGSACLSRAGARAANERLRGAWAHWQITASAAKIGALQLHTLEATGVSSNVEGASSGRKRKGVHVSKPQREREFISQIPAASKEFSSIGRWESILATP